LKKKKVIMLSQLKSYLFGAADGGLMQEPAVGDCANNSAEDDWVLVETQGKLLILSDDDLENIS
jgi:hypothetical protein